MERARVPLENGPLQMYNYFVYANSWRHKDMSCKRGHNRYRRYRAFSLSMECLKFKFVTNKCCRLWPPEQGTKDQIILGFLITSHGTPKVGVLCTVLGNTVQALDNLCKTVHKTPTLEVPCEVIKKPRIIWSFVPCSGGFCLQLLLMVNINQMEFFLAKMPYTRGTSHCVRI